MTETDITENDAPYEEPSEALDNFDAPPPAKIKRGAGWGAVLPLFLLAGIGGAVGGWALTQYVMPNYIALPQAETSIAPKVNLGPLTARIEMLEKKIAAQSSEMSFLSSEVKSGAASVTVGGVDKAFDITPLMNRLDNLETRLSAAESPLAKSPVSGEISPASNEDGSAVTAPDYLKSIEDRLVTLEKSYAESAGLSSSAQDSINQDNVNEDMSTALASLSSRVTRLEDDVEETRALAAVPTVVRETVLLPPFPRQALLTAMTAPRDQGRQSWLDKTLKKHISVRNPQEVARAEETLGTIEALVESGDYVGALKLVEAMPSDVRSVANDWTRALKAEVDTRH